MQYVHILHSRFRVIIAIIVMIFIALIVKGQEEGVVNKIVQIDAAPFADNFNHWYMGFDKNNMINPLPDRPRYKTTEIKKIGDNILLFQKKNGGWAKNYDVFAILTNKQKDSVLARSNELNTTFDNGTCYTQIEALAVVYNSTKEIKYKKGALRGLDYLLKAQYANGGWPQFYPLEAGYSRHITYNDGAMVGVMDLLKAISDKKPQYNFIDSKLRTKIEEAYLKGIDCIIKTDINDNGKLTAWCQQHDEVTLAPAWARKFEPASICSTESADLILFLMTIEHPSKEVVNVIQSAVTWFEESKILYTRVDKIDAPTMITPFRISRNDRVVVRDSSAPPIWTRYYELKTHRPVFCNRDSKVVYSLAEVDRERRDGYAWYSFRPQKVLNSYPAWQKRWAPNNNISIKMN